VPNGLAASKAAATNKQKGVNPKAGRVLVQRWVMGNWSLGSRKVPPPSPYALTNLNWKNPLPDSAAMAPVQ